jgi:hypothetical protein
VDRLGGEQAPSALLTPPQPTGDLLRPPALEQPVADEAPEVLVALEDGQALPAFGVAAFRVHRE